jgi:hypothetical protein
LRVIAHWSRALHALDGAIDAPAYVKPYAKRQRNDTTDAEGVTRHNLTIPKNDGSRADYVPASSEIDEAMLARKAVRSLFRLRPQRRVCIDVNPIGSLHRRMAL